jgi:hypothetical protein
MVLVLNVHACGESNKEEMLREEQPTKLATNDGAGGDSDVSP